jgi:hypothetical protein
MSKYKCNICNKIFKRNENLKYHSTNNACKINKYKCKLCDKEFTTNNSMYRHMKHNCNVKKQNDEEKNLIYERLLNLEKDNKRLLCLEKNNKKVAIENKKLKKKVENMEKQIKVVNNIKDNIVNLNTGTVNSTVNNNTVNNNTVNNIILVGYGNEDILKMDRSDILKVLQNGYGSTLKLTDVIHFNPKYPEYHNIYISNIKDKYAMVYDGNTWMLTTKDDLIDNIYEDKKNYIEDNLDDFIDSLSVSRRKALDRWLETDESDKKIRKIKENIKLLLYNKRNIVLDRLNDIKHVSIQDNNYFINNPDIKVIVKKNKKNCKGKQEKM